MTMCSLKVYFYKIYNNFYIHEKEEDVFTLSYNLFLFVRKKSPAITPSK